KPALPVPPRPPRGDRARLPEHPGDRAMINEPLRDNVERLLRDDAAVPSPEFLERMGRLLRPPDQHAGLVRFLRAATAVAAALCVALLLGLSGRRPPLPPAPRAPE